VSRQREIKLEGTVRVKENTIRRLFRSEFTQETRGVSGYATARIDQWARIYRNVRCPVHQPAVLLFSYRIP